MLEEILPAKPFGSENTDFIRILGSQTDGNLVSRGGGGEFFQIPNLKLSELGLLRDFSLELFNDTLDFSRIKDKLYRGVLNQFVHILLQEIQTYDKGETEKLLVLNLLVPNIYTQARVSKILTSLHEDFREILADGKYGFAGVEIQTISESDASFLGLLSDSGIDILKARNINEGDNFLIIDAGKGTTDLSVITAGQNNHFSSIYRDGFAGAGNAITYSFLDTLTAIVAGQDNTKTREEIIRKIIEMDPSSQIPFLRAMENLKKNFATGNASNKMVTLEEIKKIKNENNELYNNPSLDPELLLEIIENQILKNGQTIGDYFGLIEQCISAIIDKVITAIENSGISNFKQIILTGRAFRFSPLREKLREKLDTHFNGKMNFLYQGEKLKTCCLYGPLNFKGGTNRNADIVGTPLIFDRPDTVQKTIRKLFGKSSEKKVVYSGNENSIEEDSFFLNGFQLDLDKQSVIISGKEFNVDSEFRKEGKVNLYFIGNDFLIRTAGKGTRLKPFVQGMETNASDPLAWKSLFPNVNPAHSLVSPIPDFYKYREKTAQWKPMQLKVEKEPIKEVSKSEFENEKEPAKSLFDLDDFLKESLSEKKKTENDTMWDDI